MPRLLESELKNPSFMQSLPSRRPRIKPTQLGQSPHTKIRTALMPCQQDISVSRSAAKSVCLDIGEMGDAVAWLGVVVVLKEWIYKKFEVECAVSQDTWKLGSTILVEGGWQEIENVSCLKTLKTLQTFGSTILVIKVHIVLLMLVSPDGST